MATSDTPTHLHFSEFIASLNKAGARYLLIGGYAVGFHGRPRATKDLDVLVDAAESNAERVLRAIQEFFGGASLGYAATDLTRPGMTLQLGVAPVRIDVNTSIAGVEDFDAAWKRRQEGRLGEAKAAFISFEDLLAAKRAADRPQDRADVAHLETIRDTLRRAPEPGLKGTLGAKAPRGKKKAPSDAKGPSAPRKRRR